MGTWVDPETTAMERCKGGQWLEESYVGPNRRGGQEMSEDGVPWYVWNA